jgi:hypothetical protein
VNERNPATVDPSVIRSDLAQRYPDQDCMFDLRILHVQEEAVFDAFLFPWHLHKGVGAGWAADIDLQAYRTTTPADIKPEHLRSRATG